MCPGKIITIILIHFNYQSWWLMSAFQLKFSLYTKWQKVKLQHSATKQYVSHYLCVPKPFHTECNVCLTFSKGTKPQLFPIISQAKARRLEGPSQKILIYIDFVHALWFIRNTVELQLVLFLYLVQSVSLKHILCNPSMFAVVQCYFIRILSHYNACSVSQ